MLCQSLMGVEPDKLPDYVQAEITYDGLSVKKRVDFNGEDESEISSSVQDFLDRQR